MQIRSKNITGYSKLTLLCVQFVVNLFAHLKGVSICQHSIHSPTLRGIFKKNLFEKRFCIGSSSFLFEGLAVKYDVSGELNSGRQRYYSFFIDKKSGEMRGTI